MTSSLNENNHATVYSLTYIFGFVKFSLRSLAPKLAQQLLLARVEADSDERRGEFVVLVEGAPDDGAATLAEGLRVYAKLAEHLPPSTAARLAAELTGAPRKALYGSRTAD